MKTVLFVCIGVWLCICTSGCTLNAQFVAAEVATYEAIGEEYVDYVRNDPKLDAATKVTRCRTIEFWKATLDEAQK